jgi:hypothetical protein
MQAFVMLSIVVVALMSNGVYSLPAINTKTMSEALVAQGEHHEKAAGQVDSRGKIKKMIRMTSI